MITPDQALASFTSGLLSFLAPCLLPLFPSYFTVITGFTFSDLYGVNFENLRKRVVFSALFFCLGFAVIFTLLGATGSIIGKFLDQQLDLLIRFSGIFLIILGLMQTGVIHMDMLKFDYAWNVQRRLTKLGYATAFITGVAAALSWIPCISPLLSPFILMASRSDTLLSGMGLLFIYSLGLTLPFLIGGYFFPTMVKNIQAHKVLLHRLSLAAGVILIVFGVILLAGQYQYYVGFFQQFY